MVHPSKGKVCNHFSKNFLMLNKCPSRMHRLLRRSVNFDAPRDRSTLPSNISGGSPPSRMLRRDTPKCSRRTTPRLKRTRDKKPKLLPTRKSLEKCIRESNLSLKLLRLLTFL